MERNIRGKDIELTESMVTSIDSSIIGLEKFGIDLIYTDVNVVKTKLGFSIEFKIKTNVKKNIFVAKYEDANFFQTLLIVTEKAAHILEKLHDKKNAKKRKTNLKTKLIEESESVNNEDYKDENQVDIETAI